MSSKAKLLSALLYCAPLVGCSAPPPIPAAPVKTESACSSQVLERIYFGLQTPKGVVTAKEWKDFLATTVTPKFPAGLTVIEGNGQWLGDTGKIVQEPSRIIEIIHAVSDEESGKARSIALEYRRRFDQDAVMILKTPIDACFYTRSFQ